MELAANIDLLYGEAGDDRIARLRAAADDGFRFAEMWMTGGEDVPALAAAAREAGVGITSTVAGPRCDLVHRESHETFLDGLRTAAKDARTLGCPRVVATTGMGFPGMSRAAQSEIVAEALSRAVEIADEHDVTLLLENVNTRVDHPGSLTDLTGDNVEIARKVGSPRVRLLFDMYHALVMGEDIDAILDEHADLIDYVQIADVPGRHEPGTGDVDWAPYLRRLTAVGYTAPVGLELTTTRPTSEALRAIRELAARI